MLLVISCSAYLPSQQAKHVLERNELGDLFQQATAATWKVLYDDVAQDSDHGRPLIQFVAQKIS